MKHKNTVWNMIFLCINVLLSPMLVLADNNKFPENIKLDIATVDNRPLSIDRIIYTVLKDLGYQTTMKTATSLQQGYTLADNGEIDGVIASTPDMELAYPNLRKVSVELEQNNVTVLVQEDSDLEINNWEDLSGLRVGILTQRVYVKNSIPSTAAVIVKETTSLILEELSRGEVDVVILTLRGHETLNLPNNIICAGTIETLTEYLYLHKSKAYLIPYIEESLRLLFADGHAEKILNDITILEMYQKKTVLHFYSANSELAREEQFTAKLRGQFENDESIEWYTIALNSNRFSADPSRLSFFANLLKQDCVSRNIAAIIVSDNDALEFLKDYYFLYFRNVPVLFYGISAYDAEAITGFNL